jgi:hypothetical protein
MHGCMYVSVYVCLCMCVSVRVRACVSVCECVKKDITIEFIYSFYSLENDLPILVLQPFHFSTNNNW